MTVTTEMETTIQDMRKWITATHDLFKQSNTFIFEDADVPHQKKVFMGYKMIADYQIGNMTLRVWYCRQSSPKCYYVRLNHIDGVSLLDRLNAYIDARSILAFLVRFGWKLERSLIRQSFRNCIPENPQIKYGYYPIWFTPITLGYQTIWYTSDLTGELYMEQLLWGEEGKPPTLVDHKLFYNVGWQVRELYH